MGCCKSKSASSSARRTSLSLTYDTNTPLQTALLESSHDNESLYTSNNSRIGSRRLHQSTALLTETDAIILAANYCKERSPFKWCDETLPRIGSRELKWHYLVEGEASGNEGASHKRASKKMVAMVMAVTYLQTDNGASGGFPISLTNPTTLGVFSSLLCKGGGLDHPYLFCLEDLTYIREKHALVTTRLWVGENGSLRDVIYSKQRPKNSFAQKYARDNGKALAATKVKEYGRHILEGLKALNAKGIIADCLTCCNVLICDDVARISDLENTILGAGASMEMQEMLMLNSAVAIERGLTPSPFDVQLFGLVLLEMSTGAPIVAECFAEEVEDNFYDRRFSTSDDENTIATLRGLLNSIFVSHDATVVNLIESDFFSSVQLPLQPSRLKLSSAEKGLVKSAMKASSDKRSAVLRAIQAKREEAEIERQQRMRDLEETSLATSNNDGDLRVDPNMRRVQVLKRQSLKLAKKNTHASHSADEKTNNYISPGDEGHNPTVNDFQPQSNSSGLPAKYQKLLDIGLHQDQVRHKMIQDGFEPASVGW